MKVWTKALAIAAATLLAVACAQSDAGITTKVKTKLAADSAVKSSQVNVDTKDKIVTLSGNVDNNAAKSRAVELARDTTGVLDVVDNLSVASPPATGTSTMGTAVDDAAITTAVKAKLLAEPQVGGLKIDVDTKDGVVTLTSDGMNSQGEITVALQIARDTSGVKDVQNRMTVKNPTS